MEIPWSQVTISWPKLKSRDQGRLSFWIQILLVPLRFLFQAAWDCRLTYFFSAFENHSQKAWVDPKPSLFPKCSNIIRFQLGPWDYNLGSESGITRFPHWCHEISTWVTRFQLGFTRFPIWVTGFLSGITIFQSGSMSRPILWKPGEGGLNRKNTSQQYTAQCMVDT